MLFVGVVVGYFEVEAAEAATWQGELAATPVNLAHHRFRGPVYGSSRLGCNKTLSGPRKIRFTRFP